MTYLNLADLRLCTEAEGPGKRAAIWVQGCNKRCTGCCNINMQELKENIIVKTNDLIELLDKSRNENLIEGITLLGGEPILQAEGLSNIAAWCKNKNLSVILFTGYLYEELLALSNFYVNRLIENTDVLIDGPFIKEKYDYKRDWVGSENQRVFFLTSVYTEKSFYTGQRCIELMLSDKDILINGWPYDK